MEENQPIQSPQVSFPQPREPEARKGSNARVVIAIIGVIIIVVLGGWFILGNRDGSATPTPTPVGGLSTFPTPGTAATPETSPTPTPAPVDKSEVKIEVLNGTGVPGEASFLEKELVALGFENIKAGNADEQNATETVVTYSRDFSQATADEITAKLEEIYTTVRTRKATPSGDFDVSITTGPRKGGSTAKPATAKPSATATATPKASASATPTPTATPTSTP